MKPKSDVYTALLAVSFLAILLGILCLCLELSRYNWQFKPGGVAAAAFGQARTAVATAPADDCASSFTA